MSYRLFTIKVIPECCGKFQCLPSPIDGADSVPNPKLFALAVLSAGAEVLELGVEHTAQHTHGDHPMHLWDISGQTKSMHRVFGWLNAEGFAEYMGAQRVEEA